MDQSSLKDYYISLERLYNNCVNILTALNQSLSTTASEITVTVADTDDAESTLRIPSYLYLESRIEQLNNNFSLLFDLPESGEAWFTKSADMYKMEMVKSNSAPVSPSFDTTNMFTSFKENIFLRDLVNPKTYLKLDATNLKDNIHEVVVKKIIYKNPNLYNQVVQSGVKTYEDYKAILYSQNEGIDYEEYDSILRLPIRNNKYKSNFRITEIPTLESGNPFRAIASDDSSHLIYKVRLDTIKYSDSEDSSIIFTLQQGDYLTLQDNFGVYKVLDISNYIENANECIVTLEECAGHTTLQTFEENSSMIFKLYNDNFEKFKYVEVPLEENEFITVFISAIYNNVRSTFSDGININLNDLKITNSKGEIIYHNDTNIPYTYIEYYNEYCKNIGDILAGITNTIYPQFTNFTFDELKELQNSENLKKIVSLTINDDILKVTKINDHLIDDTATKRVLQLHSEKNEKTNQLTAIQANIDKTYNQLTTTDFSQDLSVSQTSLKNKLDQYYSERLTLNKQLISIVNEINTLKSSVSGYNSSKYRIRGVVSEDSVQNYIQTNIDERVNVIGIDVEYKYSSVNSDTANVLSINSNLFTNWNKLNTIDKQRKLVFNNITKTYQIEYEDYSSISDIVKWNQIDIPISQGEDVSIRIRYKYSVGQPFVNFYTPWSDELKITFPVEYIETNELNSVIDQNDVDVINTQFLNTLINNGYEEHINNKIVDGSQQFYHMPENIYSGFNTPENKLLSLKDKLQSIVNDIESVKELYQENNYKYNVYLEYDSNVVEIYNFIENKINISNIDNISSSFIRKNINLIIKNTGNVPVNLYSIFPGPTNQILQNVESTKYKNIEKYERVPVILSGVQDINESILFQSLGQFIYFREDNPYTSEKLYYDNPVQNRIDLNTKIKTNKNGLDENGNPVLLSFSQELSWFQNGQLMMPINNRENKKLTTCDIVAKIINDSDSHSYSLEYIDTSEMSSGIMGLKYNTDEKPNSFILKYEHLYSIKNNEKIYLSENTSINDFVTSTTPKSLTTSMLNGSFLFPELTFDSQLICNKTSETNAQYYSIAVGDKVVIPLVFEYFIMNNSTNMTTSKTICFDIKPGVDKDIVHYILTITGSNTLTSYNTEYSNVLSESDRT